MLTTYFTRERTRATYAAGPTGPYLDDFSQWLEKRGFTTRTIRRCLFGATQFATWAEAASIPVPCLDTTSLEAFRCSLAQHNRLRYASGNPTSHCMGAHHFLTFLSTQSHYLGVSRRGSNCRPPSPAARVSVLDGGASGCHRADPTQLPTYSP